MQKNTNARSLVTKLLDLAGITVNGSALWDVQIHNDQFYSRVLRDADLGLGESYMDGWWDCQRIDMLIEHIVNANIEDKVKISPKLALRLIMSKIFNFQSRRRAFQVGRHHYDLGNDLFEAMLDRHMNYTCGYWKEATTLEEAQLAKLDLSCRKLQLEPGMRMLDIGCGWGALAKYAAENYGVEVVGITISKQQYELAKERCKDLPVEIRVQDYREVNEKFDRIVSLGMFEHVGYLNYRKYMQVAHRCLADDGLFLLHTIGGNESTTQAMPWISKYIFPNGMIPSIAQIGKASEKLFVMEDWQNFGMDYYQTLMAWHQNFNTAWNYLQTNYDEKFFRMWNYYLLSCAGGFNTRMLQLWQIVFSKGLKMRYDAPR
ncbi:cyclopropane fatty acyl phospholipid synthase [Legionella hackeliae]|uniref:Cyclopropane-fatty-acyl-phospholipid synthase n=1 Tax=Legionella hackeliae TaxID=449 RepID=A0A0A8UTU2_LEGHA|nr:cyclopropane fatty acyl phospholipid synthase [Legionella hackeliae]KTD13816.1 cyclopropane fatty acid synthase [Legionella hackeliae]CEK10517.1 Cyclopropane-fatty-acyl-phospholipid synthase [Legionella hackeliae]STX47254.1 cyclopropane fatty acid synthase [Legionella hackeliae]